MARAPRVTAGRSRRWSGRGPGRGDAISQCEATSGAGGRSMTDKELLELLKGLLSSQFEEVVFLLGIPPAYLSVREPQAVRAIEVIRYATDNGLRDELEDLVQPARRGDATTAVESYRARKSEAFVRWDLRNAGPAPTTDSRPTQTRLDDMYIPLRFAPRFDPFKVSPLARSIVAEDLLQPPPLASHELDSARRAGRDHALREAHALPRRWVVIGVAGSGKTTWMRSTFRRLIEKAGVLPVFLEARAIAATWRSSLGAEQPFDHYLAGALAECNIARPGAILGTLLADSSLKVVVLIDGWDELGDAQGDRLRERLLEFSGAYPGVAIVVSSRPYGATYPARAEMFRAQYIQPLSDDDIRMLAQRFQRHAHGLAQPREYEARAEEFMVALALAPNARSLASTALLLTMMLLLWHQAPLPGRGHRLYHACLRNMLIYRVTRLSEEKRDRQWRPDDDEELFRVVAELAYRLQTKDGKPFHRTLLICPWDEAVQLLKTEWPQRENFLRWLIASAGVLVDRADGSVQFSHLSFQEHLVAHHLFTTCEGDQRITMMLEHMADRSWWETLRQWAALIGDQRPEKLTPVFDKLRTKPDGYWLAGQIFADGTGRASDFAAWCAELASRLCDPSDASDDCAVAWGSCKQSDRLAILRDTLAAACTSLHWLDGSRHAHWCKLANLNVPRAAKFRAVEPPINTPQAVARSRVLFGGAASWPDGDELAVLRIWPSTRVAIGIRLQSAISLGAGPADLLPMLPTLLVRANRLWSGKDHALLEGSVGRWIKGSDGTLIRQQVGEFGMSFVQDFVRDTVRYLFGYFAVPLHEEVLESEQAMMDRVVQEFGRLFVRTVVREFAERFERDFIRDFTLYYIRGVVRDYPREFADEFPRYFSREFARDFGQYFALHFTRELEQALQRSRSEVVVPSWLPALAFLEASSVVGRATPRVALAHGSFPKEMFLLGLFKLACQASFEPGSNFLDESIQRSCAAFPGHPLWPALARHMARRSEPVERALLENLARHPENCAPPLSWGLQYYVRGDLLFDDDSIVTLDELCDRCNVPPPPLLEDLPPELHIPLDHVIMRRDLMRAT
ncbi:MAG: NACHT domain-containing protein [Deltaproteobacteria bacterium]|nr:MAG: NACHT domain-containing protein [Deltaproteobacteria bacterium]